MEGQVPYDRSVQNVQKRQIYRDRQMRGAGGPGQGMGRKCLLRVGFLFGGWKRSRNRCSGRLML